MIIILIISGLETFILWEKNFVTHFPKILKTWKIHLNDFFYNTMNYSYITLPLIEAVSTLQYPSYDKGSNSRIFLSQ